MGYLGGGKAESRERKRRTLAEGGCEHAGGSGKREGVLEGAYAGHRIWVDREPLTRKGG